LTPIELERGSAQNIANQSDNYRKQRRPELKAKENGGTDFAAG
jgi:hypothetical protein